MTTNSWILPDGINEILAPNGWKVETLRRQILDMYQTWGYDLVMPPIVEHLDSLLTGSGRQLDLQTFKITDLVSGRLIGLRADITPQIARIDASQNHENPARYCYIGTVVHTKASDFNGVRDPLQIGVELFGHNGLESDLEVITLMLTTLAMTGINNITLDIGHVGIVKSLLADSVLTQTTKDQLFNAISRKSLQEIEMICDEYKITSKAHIIKLIECNGDKTAIKACLALFDGNDLIKEKIQHLLHLEKQLSKAFPQINTVFDLAELKGYQYHTGVIFSAYVEGKGKAIARGGRYDEIGKEFGKYRAATGFSTDLKSIIDFSGNDRKPKTVLAPNVQDEQLVQFILKLREKNNKVIQSFNAEPSSSEKVKCSHSIQLINNQWQLTEEAHGE